MKNLSKETILKVLRELSFYAMLFLAVFAVRHSFAENYKIPSGSMEPTLKEGDYVFALKCSYFLRFPFTDWILLNTGEVDRGDIVIFPSVENPKLNLIKRVIGLPGDKLEMRNDKLFINGDPVPLELEDHREDLYDIEQAEYKDLLREKLGTNEHLIVIHRRQFNSGFNFPEITVPEGHVFMMGDNRDHSRDSRYFGFVPIESIKGKAGVIYLSLDKSKGFPWRMRFERLGHVVR